MLYLRAVLLGPGVVLHELAHHLFCILCRVRVRKVVYFRLGTPAGYVDHAVPLLFRQNLLIVAGPLLLNSTFAVVALHAGSSSSAGARELRSIASAALALWLGISAALNALPSERDAANLWQAACWHVRRANLLATVGYPVAALLFLASKTSTGKFAWIYAAALGLLAVRWP